MFRRIEGSVVVITGASTGIGRASSLEFARAGATVVVSSRRERALRSLAERREQLGGKAIAVAADVTKQRAMEELARRAIEAFGRIDVWINNAAVTLFARFEESPPEIYRKVIETNLFGCIHGARAALPYFREQGSGVLINVASGVGRVGAPYISAYASSKFAIIGLTESLRMEVRDAPGIHVCAVLPGSIDTPLFQHGANFSGRAVKPVPPVYGAERVASALVRLARCPRREISVGGSVRAGLALRAVAPALAERVFARETERKHFEDRPAPRSEGNVFKPSDVESVGGGWRSPASRCAAGGALLGAAACGAFMALFLGWRVGRGGGFRRKGKDGGKRS